MIMENYFANTLDWFRHVLNLELAGTSFTTMKKRGRCISLNIHLLCFFMVSCGHGLDIKGYDFGDNMMNVRMGPDNGFLRADMPGLIPSNLSICTRVYTANIRHGNQLGI